jgi:hypothetical protein
VPNPSLARHPSQRSEVKPICRRVPSCSVSQVPRGATLLSPRGFNPGKQAGGEGDARGNPCMRKAAAGARRSSEKRQCKWEIPIWAVFAVRVFEYERSQSSPPLVHPGGFEMLLDKDVLSTDEQEQTRGTRPEVASCH